MIDSPNTFHAGGGRHHPRGAPRCGGEHEAVSVPQHPPGAIAASLGKRSRSSPTCTLHTDADSSASEKQDAALPEDDVQAAVPPASEGHDRPTRNRCVRARAHAPNDLAAVDDESPSLPAVTLPSAPNPAAYPDPVVHSVVLASHALHTNLVRIPPAMREELSSMIISMTNTMQAQITAMADAWIDVVRRHGVVDSQPAETSSSDGEAEPRTDRSFEALVTPDGYVKVPSTSWLQSWTDLEDLWDGKLPTPISTMANRSDGPVILKTFPKMSEWSNDDARWACRVKGQSQKRSVLHMLLEMFRAAKQAAGYQHIAANGEFALRLDGAALDAAAIELLKSYHRCLHKPSELAYRFQRRWFRDKRAACRDNPFLHFPPDHESRSVSVR